MATKKRNLGGNIDVNPEDLEFKEIQTDTSNELDFGNLEFVHSQMGEYLINQAQELLSRFVQKLDPDAYDQDSDYFRTKTTGVYQLYKEALQVEEPEDYIPIIENIRKNTSGSIDDLLKAKYVYELNSHKSLNAFELNSIKSGSSIETARVNWTFAIKTFEEEKQNAEAVFQETLYAAKLNENYKLEAKHPNLTNIITSHENFYKYATKVADAIDAYGKTMTKATNDLSKAYATLMTELIKNWNIMAQGEATLLVANKKDATTLWDAIKKTYDKKLSGTR